MTIHSEKICYLCKLQETCRLHLPFKIYNEGNGRLLLWNERKTKLAGHSLAAQKQTEEKTGFL